MYWVVPGRLCAGEYPLEQLDLLRAAGVDAFLDLTEEGEYGVPSYHGELGGLEYVRHAIPDRGVPKPEQMTAILEYLDDAFARGRTVYVHCMGGIGRTGMTVACHLIRGGSTPEAALAQIAEWRRHPLAGDGRAAPLRRLVGRSGCAGGV